MRQRRWLLLGVLSLLASACPGPDPSATDLGSSPVGTCSHRCPTCASDEVCAPGLGGFAGYAATCLKRCTSSTDCGPGQRCVSLYGELLRDTVCISPITPPLCPDRGFDPRWHCDFPPGECKDSKTLWRPYSQPENQACGAELVTCPTSCGTVDGGVFPTSGECR